MLATVSRYWAEILREKKENINCNKKIFIFTYIYYKKTTL